MANWTGQGPMLLHGTPLDASDTAQRYPVLTRAFDVNGAEWIYLKGVASTRHGDWVTYDEAGVTARLAATSEGPLAVAGAAHLAGNFGWYQIYGSNTHAAVSASIGDNGILFATATAGEADDAVVQGDRIYNAITRSTGNTSDTALTEFCTVQLNYPNMDQYSADTAAVN